MKMALAWLGIIDTTVGGLVLIFHYGHGALGYVGLGIIGLATLIFGSYVHD